ncbi:MAG: metal ABC transporter permease [Candidatus Aminicenantes bacterium]
MEALYSYGFLQRAFIAGLFVAVACALLGVFLILRRDAMIGHGLAHVTFAGVALGLLLKIMPLAVALVVAVLTSLVIMKLKERAGLYGDTAIAIFSSTGFALGILLVTLAHSFNVDLFGYLFGEILAIEAAEVWLSVALAAAVVLTVIVYYSRFMYMTFDRESAKVAGIKVGRLDVLLSTLTAVTVVLGMKIVGLLLVAALVVIPAAAGLQLASSFKQAMVISSLAAVVSVVFGLMLAFYIDLPASGSIVVLSFIIFGLSFVFRKERKLL